jgi:hypothetical protein
MNNLNPLKNRAVVAVTCIAVLLAARPAAAQSYFPAGLGNGSLQLWLTASDPTTLLTTAGTQAANGNSIATWTDKSGKGLNATQATGSKQPVYQTNQLNGFGGVIWQNNTQYMTGGTGSWRTVVTTRAMLGTSYQYLFSSPSLTDFSIRFTGGTTTVSYTDGPNVNDWDYNTGAPPTQWINGVQSTTGTTVTHILVDQSLSNTIGTYSLSSTFLNRGMYNNDPVYELFVYSSVLNTTQRKLLENYQASEWGLTADLPGGYPVFTPPAANKWNRNLVGIGLTSGADNFTNDAALSTDGLGFFSGTTGADFLGSAGYIMAAHNGQANTTLSNPVLPSVPANSFMWNRSWYIQQFNGVSTGNVTLNFRFPDYDGSSPNAGYHFGILYNATDGTFATGTNKQITFVSYTVSASSVAFVVKANNLPVGYYTIIWNVNNVLPITLESFTVTKSSTNAALAKWTMGPNFGQGHFAVQRSADGVQYNTIGTVGATGNDAVAESYSYTDQSPLAGVNYYRLMMTDGQGNTSYSPIATLAFNSTSRVVTLYPNPARGSLHISAPGINGGGSIGIISATGQLVATYPVATLDGANLPIGNLPAGSWFAQIKTATGQSFVQPFVKR